MELYALYLEILCTEAMEKSPVNGGGDSTQGFPHPAYWCIPLQLYLAYISQPRVLVATEDYHVIVITNIPVNRIAEQLEGNIGKYARRGNVTAQARYHFGQCMGHPFHGLNIENLF
jgi:hypothetical protein